MKKIYFCLIDIRQSKPSHVIRFSRHVKNNSCSIEKMSAVFQTLTLYIYVGLNFKTLNRHDNLHYY